jgi:protein-tyrosine phosphatase
VRLTSKSSPIRVDFLPNDETGLSGRIGLTFAPGKQRGRWNRDLDQDLARLRTEYGVTLLVSLIEGFEFEKLNIRELPGRAQELGIDLLWHPVRDVSVPASVEDAGIVVRQIIDHARTGANVAIHCWGGLGRTGLMAACCLVAVGRDVDEAIQVTRVAREGTIQTGEQAEWIELFRKHWAREDRPVARRLTDGDVDAIVRFLPELESGDPGFIVRESPEGCVDLDPFEYEPWVLQLVQTLYDTEFIFSHDWSAWAESRGASIVQGKAPVELADLLTLRRFVTAAVRSDRFCAGTLASLLEDGRLCAVVQRVDALRKRI